MFIIQIGLNGPNSEEIQLLYCTISNCSAWPVSRDRHAEILHRQRPVGRVTRKLQDAFRHAENSIFWPGIGWPTPM